MAYATAEDQRREIGDRLAQLLRNIPVQANESDIGFLVQILHMIDADRYFPEFERLLQTHTHGLVVTPALLAIADSDQTRGIQEVRRRIRLFADGAEKTDYHRDVRPYLDLLITADAHETLPDLRRAQRRIREQDRGTVSRRDLEDLDELVSALSTTE